MLLQIIRVQNMVQFLKRRLLPECYSFSEILAKLCVNKTALEGEIGKINKS